MNMPFLVSLQKNLIMKQTISEQVEIFFCLKGNLNVQINRKNYLLRETDLILINDGDIYDLKTSKESLVLVLKMNHDMFNNSDEGLFMLNTILNENDHFDDIRKILVTMLFELSKKESYKVYLILSLSYNLLYILDRYFKIIDKINLEDEKYDERIKSIISYIKNNYTQPISLQEVAETQFLTPQYLSKFFKQQTGLTLSKYITEYRLGQAVKSLIRTEYSVTKIAMDYGFPNLAAFNKIFREVYNTTPADYRSKIRKNIQSGPVQNEVNLFDEKINDLEKHLIIEQLQKYVIQDDNGYLDKKSQTNSREIIVTCKDTHIIPIKHTWKNLLNIGYASDGIRSDLQEHVKIIQSKIKFKYARFQGIFNDQMLDITNDRLNGSSYNFNKIDKLIDFLYSVNLKPFIELGDKAKLLNLKTDEVLFFEKNTRKQRDLTRSLDLIEKFIIHTVNRYGLDEVSTWYFEIWKPGDNDYIFWNGDFKPYFEQFKAYYQLIKKMVPLAKVGGPGFDSAVNLNYFDEFVRNFKLLNVKMDFLSLSLYPYEIVEDDNIQIGKRKSNIGGFTKLDNLIYAFPSKSRNYSNEMLESVRIILQKEKVNLPEIHVTEYNATISHRNPTNDTIYKSAFVTKNILDNLDETASFGYWFCSDISGELNDSKLILNGEMGMMSNDGICKPAFFAYEMLSKLGNELIDKGNGYIITKKNSRDFGILTYNYKHFAQSYCLSEGVSLDEQYYYDIYENTDEMSLSFCIKGVADGHYRVKQYILNREHGSLFDEWQSMKQNIKHFSNLKKEEINYLKSISVPKQVFFEINATDKILKFDVVNQAHEINYFEITFDYNL
ncbi:GH39 family glycosyl hydrolase [Enterococcus casseliflavus]|uniref:GH39 family glycosyl hydrolase n=1 Tax=Enterococcus casseliflavus TaxID=37734 RepID=UPI00115E957A|nr:helix-turn-helix domain-containing protein [Enterococcus casseliflavus]